MGVGFSFYVVMLVHQYALTTVCSGASRLFSAEYQTEKWPENDKTCWKSVASGAKVRAFYEFKV